MNLLPTPHLDSALQNLAVKDPQKWSPVRLWLDFLKIFLAFAQVWGNAASAAGGAREHLKDLPGRITTELENIEDAFKEADTAKLLEMMDEFNPRIMDAYKFLSSGYAFKNNTLSYVILREQRWFPSFGSLLGIHSASFSSSNPLYDEFQSVLNFLDKLQLRQIMFRDCELFRDLCVEHGGVAIFLAGQLFSCWAEGENEANLWDLVLVKIKPTTTELLAQYLKAIKSQIHSLQEELMVELVEITLLSPSGSQKLNPPPGVDCLVFLIRHLVHSPGAEDDDIKRILCKAAAASDPDSLGQSFQEAQLDIKKKEEAKLLRDIKSILCEAAAASDPDSLGQSLQDAESLRTEMLLAELGDRKSICERPRLEDAYSENMMQILEEMETLMISPEMGGPNPYVKVSLDFYIALFQAFLKELMSPISALVVKVQVQELCNESKRFRRYSSILPLRNPEEMKPISELMVEAADVAESLPGFFQSNHVPEQHVSILSGMLSKFLEKLTVLNGKMEEVYLRFRESAMVSLPKTLPGLSFVECFLERLRGIPDGNCIKPRIKAVLEGEDSLAEVLKMVEEGEDKDEELRKLKRRVTQAAYEADYIIDSMLVLLDADRCHLLWLSDALSEMNLVKADLMKFGGEKKHLVQVQGAVKSWDTDEPAIPHDIPEVGEYIVPLDVRVNDVVNHLLSTEESGKYIVGVVGMPGVGKTTLARMVYDHPSVRSHFEKRAWCTISQKIRMTDVLVKILRDIDYELIGTLEETNDENKLLTILNNELQEKTYLIVMDDIWIEEAWTRLKKGLPKREGSCSTQNKSRILFTSRNENVLSRNNFSDVLPYSQKPLGDKESWKLLKRRVFGENLKCPEGLRKVGREIANSCKGLPLAVVAVSGILRKKEQEPREWDKINEHLSSNILDKLESPCHRILELSYSHLPDYLKPCLVYFAAFREDQEIQVNRLIRLWISEGFVRQVHSKPKPKPELELEPEPKNDKVDDDDDDDDDDDGKVYVTAVREKVVDDDAGVKVDSLEDVAMKYVDDLISRSLIIAYKRSVSTKKVKVCKIHDLLHKLCLDKAAEDNFFESETKYSERFPPNTKDHGLHLNPINNIPPPTYNNNHRVGIYSKRNQFVKLQPSGEAVRTLLFSADTPDTRPTCPYDLSFIPRNFKILKVLDIGTINLDSTFPEKILDLHPLRYLAVEGDIVCIPASINGLQNLEDFTVTGLKDKVALPSTIWTMSKLRHLHVYTSLPLDFGGHVSFQLLNLRTLSSPDLSKWEDLEAIMRKAPELRKLKCAFSPALHSTDYFKFARPEQLLKLEYLKVAYTGQSSEPWDLEFPKHLNKLSLKDFRLTSDSMSSIGNLPRLEFLTLDSISFDESIWEMEDDEFKVLKTLKLYSVKLQDWEWEVPSSNFLKLKQLVFRNCQHLDRLPAAFAKISDIEEIELIQCSDVTELAGFVNERDRHTGIGKLTITVNGIKISPSTLLIKEPTTNQEAPIVPNRNEDGAAANDHDEDGSSGSDQEEEDLLVLDDLQR